MTDAVMLFAAGFGTRMGPLTKALPKPLVPVTGRPLIDHAMEIVRDAGVPRVVVNAHYKAEQIVDHFAGSDVQVIVEDPKILDTGGGLKAALPLLDAEVVFTMNTDAVWDGPNPLAVLQDAWRADMQALLLCVPLPRAIGRIGRGDFDLGDGRARWGSDAVYTGVQMIRTDLVSGMAEDVFSLRTIWERLAAEDRLNAVTYPGKWCDVGHADGILLAEQMLSHTDV